MAEGYVKKLDSQLLLKATWCCSGGVLLAIVGPRTCRALVPRGCVGQSSSGAGRCTSLWCWVGEAEERHLGGLAEYELKGFDGFINQRWMWVSR